jgi:hypothetical protein
VQVEAVQTAWKERVCSKQQAGVEILQAARNKNVVVVFFSIFWDGNALLCLYCVEKVLCMLYGMLCNFFFIGQNGSFALSSRSQLPVVHLGRRLVH